MSRPETLRYRRFIAGNDAIDLAQATELDRSVAGRRILVTGAGGFIGSALAQVIVGARPAHVTLLDSSEHNLFSLGRGLGAALELISHNLVLGSVEDSSLLNNVFNAARPDVVYHAAAFKHVPLLEGNPLAALRNNTLGAYALAQGAIRHNVPKLILVSTDKAVNPSSIMGASKRLAEQIVISLNTPLCRMNAVRLVNVIGSTGSVLEIFREQLAAGMPLTVTDARATRYFMSRGESVRAVLDAGRAHCSGRVLLPEVAEAENIEALARFLVSSSVNPSICHIGLRPGEKLHEETRLGSEVQEGVTNEGLAVLQSPAPSPIQLAADMRRLAHGLAAGDSTGLLDLLREMVPEYRPSSVVLAALGLEQEVAGR